jgi:hypothetical protein
MTTGRGWTNKTFAIDEEKKEKRKKHTHLRYDASGSCWNGLVVSYITGLGGAADRGLSKQGKTVKP